MERRNDAAYRQRTRSLIFSEKKKAYFPSIDEAPAKIVRPRKVKAELKVKFEREVSGDYGEF